MARVCNDCVSDEQYCSICTRNPNIPRYSNYYKPYNPTCRFGNDDCIHDPAYIFCYHKQWYHEMWGDIPPNEVIDCCQCNDGENYDWEDK